MHNEAGVITGQPSTDLRAEGSDSTDSIEETKTAFLQLHIHEIRETAPLPAHNVTVDVSPAEEDCGDDPLETPRLSSRGPEHSSPVSNNTSALSSSPPYSSSTDTKERLTVQTASSPDNSRRFSLSRSSTFSFGESGDSLLSSSLSPLDPGSDGVRSGFGSLLRDNGTTQPNAQAWPRLWESNVSPNSSMKSPDLLADVQAEDSAIPQHVLDNVNSVQPSVEISQQNESQGHDAQRPYTSFLGVPEDCEFGGPSDPSVISDAGDQQHKRQKRANRKVISRESSIIQDERKTRERIDSVATSRASRYEFQRKLFKALVKTRNPDLHLPEKGFLPKAQLDRLVNKDSVLRELKKELKDYYPPQRIEEFADAVCQEEEVLHGNKEKIKSFRKIFALLVLTETSKSIGLFLDENVSDLDLPLVDIGDIGDPDLRRRDSSGHPCVEPLKCFDHDIWSPTKLDNFKRDQWMMLAPFFSQGDDGDVKHYSLKPQHILPFVAPEKEKEDDTEYHGGYGKVFMVRIHEEHHNFRDTVLCKRGFAIKQLYENNRELFNREVKILKTFSGERSHKHIVSLLATYEHLGKFHLIFYRAEGDLLKHWLRFRYSPGFKYEDILWMAEQCAGLADGLFKLHKHLTFRRVSRVETVTGEVKRQPSGERGVRFVDPPAQREREVLRQSSDKIWPNSPTSLRSVRRSTGEHPGKPIHHQPFSGEVEVQYGRHGDINPRNILWYDDSAGDSTRLKGTLKISDFGQAEFNSQFSRSRQRDVANTMTYRPPECDLQPKIISQSYDIWCLGCVRLANNLQPKIISQSYDIWCLGCVFLEFVAWMLGGDKLVNEFARKRQAMDVFIGESTDTFYEIIRESGTDQTKVMIKEAVTTFINDLHQHSNCTEYFHEFLNLIENSMLVVESSSRMNCEEIRKALDGKFQKCCSDKDYAAQTNPWCSSILSPARFTEPVEMRMTEDAEQYLASKLSSLPERPCRATNSTGRSTRSAKGHT